MDLIDRQAAIDKFEPWLKVKGYSEGELNMLKAVLYELTVMPPAQPEKQHGRTFREIVVEYPSYNTYPEYKGKPYFSIKYTESGQEFIGYGTYKPEVLSEYLKEYFMPSAQSYTTEEIDKMQELESVQTEKAYELGRESAQPEQRWIPCSERLPEAKQRVLVTFPDGTVDIKICIDAGHLKWFFAHMVAWMPLPEPYEEGDTNG